MFWVIIGIEQQRDIVSQIQRKRKQVNQELSDNAVKCKIVEEKFSKAWSIMKASSTRPCVYAQVFSLSNVEPTASSEVDQGVFKSTSPDGLEVGGYGDPER
jgi:hypothetical protein